MRNLEYGLAGKRVWVAGHRGLVGSALVRALEKEDCTTLTAPRAEVDLRERAQVDRWMRENRPQAVFLAAAKVGGILANDSRPAEFLYENLLIQNNVIDAARRHEVEKLVFLGSSCIYPRLAEQPISEDALLTGPLEPTNQWYAIAKIAGIKLCQAYRRQYGCDFISVMPTNLYGPNDNFDPLGSHVVPALIRKVHAAKESNAETFEIWGTGSPLRDLLYVDDAADGMVFLLKKYSGEDIVNLGSASEITILALAEKIAEVAGYNGRIRFDRTKPDGTPRKIVDVSRLAALGWRAKVPLEEGLRRSYAWYVENYAEARLDRASGA
ncbi:MAG: GDP-L-fucose synthase family protein [Reyranellaceae bacterium]